MSGPYIRNRKKLKYLRAGPVAGVLLALGVAALTQCGGSVVDQCRKERDRETVCGLLALDYARICSTDATAAGQSNAACFTPVVGALLLCPLQVSEECE